MSYLKTPPISTLAQPLGLPAVTGFPRHFRIEPGDLYVDVVKDGFIPENPNFRFIGALHPSQFFIAAQAGAFLNVRGELVGTLKQFQHFDKEFARISYSRKIDHVCFEDCRRRRHFFCHQLLRCSFVLTPKLRCECAKKHAEEDRLYLEQTKLLQREDGTIDPESWLRAQATRAQQWAWQRCIRRTWYQLIVGGPDTWLNESSSPRSLTMTEPETNLFSLP
jgi:hypothetical protein